MLGREALDFAHLRQDPSRDHRADAEDAKQRRAAGLDGRFDLGVELLDPTVERPDVAEVIHRHLPADPAWLVLEAQPGKDR